MHEVALTESIVQVCSERAGDARVLRVTLQIGTLACVLPDALRFCYDIAVEGTPLQGSELEIVRSPARCRCRTCGTVFEMDDILSRCACGSVDHEAPSGGDELRILSMEIEEKTPEVS
ncbi:MAG: hydrogenase maturation nickel metallochaperone HypA/HybF [Gammaproteobacteria bacterium]